MNTTASRLSDPELVAEVARLARGEREATATLIEHVAELHGRRRHESAGFSSLFTYCTQILRLSEHEAYDRMKAAKMVRRYPAVLRLLASGQVNLTTVRLLAPRLTRQNHEELLAAAAGKSKRQVLELLAGRFPQPDVASSVRKVPAPSVAVAPGPVPAVVSTTTSEAPAVGNPNQVPAPASPPPLVHPLAPDRYRVTFTATEETCRKLELARDLLRHAVPSGDAAEIVSRALDLLVEDLVKRKFALTHRPQASRGHAEDSRHVPAEVKRAVFIRDGGRCAFVGTGGRRCGERAFVEFHHLIPYAVGGPPSIDNIGLRCRAHNGHEVERFFGPARRYRGADAVHEVAPPDAASSGTRFRSGTSGRGARSQVVQTFGTG